MLIPSFIARFRTSRREWLMYFAFVVMASSAWELWELADEVEGYTQSSVSPWDKSSLEM